LQAASPGKVPGPAGETSRILQEVICASTGTVHTFAASLVLGVKGLTQQIFKGQPSETDPQLERLRQYISRWDGPTGLRDRVLGLTGMAATPSTTSLLIKLKSQGLVTESQIKVWKELRPKIAHGNVIDYADEKLWQNQNLLIDFGTKVGSMFLK
jgi:O6-methylguanine-DNA--protein-cysteine methyltransferase